MSAPALTHAPAATRERSDQPARPSPRLTPNQRPPTGRALVTLHTRAARLRDQDPSVPAGTPPRVAEVLRGPGAGEPLPRALRARLESGLGVDLGALRVHTSAQARTAAATLGARAFTVGRRIFLGERASIHDTGLIAHEAAHAIQQQDAAAIQTLRTTAGSEGALEREAASAGRAVAGGGSVSIDGRATSAAPQHEDESPEFVERQIMGLVRGNAPWLIPIIEQGPVNWLADRVVDGLRAVLDTVMAPVRTITGTVTEMREHVSRLSAWMIEIGGQLAKGDCSGLAAAAAKVQLVAEGLAAPALDKIKQIAGQVSAFFTAFWADYGAPVWERLQRHAAAQWRAVEQFATRAWDATGPVRAMIGRAWAWLLRRLGIAEDVSDAGGLLGWVKRKAAEAWETIKAKLEPYKRQLAVVAGILVLLSPAGPIIIVGAAMAGLVLAGRWLARVFGRPGGIVTERRTFAQEIAPTVRRVTGVISAGLSRAATFLVTKLTGVVAGLQAAAGTLTGSLLSFLLVAANWLLARFNELLAWVTDRVNALAVLVGAGLEKLAVWLQPVLRVLDRVGAVLENILEVVILVAERAWNALPGCIRDPVANFLVEHLLKKIPILKEILEVPNVWTKVKDLARTVIRRIFRGGLDLAGAGLAIFRFLLEVLQVPMELVTSIFKKAGAAIDVIVANPAAFLRNLLRGLALGVGRFLDNGLTHLTNGVVGWLSGQLPRGVRAPIPFTAGNVFRFVVDVLGITTERVWGIVQRVAPPPVYKALRAAGTALSAAWDWLQTAQVEGPAGLWRRFTEGISTLATTVTEAVAGFLFEKIVKEAGARLLTMMDPTGVMAVVNSILLVYDTIRSAIEYLARILQIVDGYLDSVLEIAAGTLAGAAQRIERLLAMAVPVAVGFLANILRISGLASRLREAIGTLQAWVEKGIEKLVRGALRIGGAALTAVGRFLGLRDLPTTTFTEDNGHEHTIAFPATGEEPTVASSDPRPIKKFVEDFQIKGKTDVRAVNAALVKIAAAVKVLGARTPPNEARATELRLEIVEQEKIIAAQIKPIFDRRAQLIAERRYELEGMTGPHSSMQFPNDRMDADHQPHNLLLQLLADMDAARPEGARNRKLFAGRRLVTIAANRSAAAYTIILGRRRHALGRTYGGKSEGVAKTALTQAREDAAQTPDDLDKQRSAVIAVLRASMKDDVQTMMDVVGRTSSQDEVWGDIEGPEADRKLLIDAVRAQIIAGEKQVLRQPLETYAE